MSGNETKAKIFCIGSNLESFECLKFLVSQNCIIDTLITLPRNEGQNVSDYVDLHEFCELNGINVIDTTNVNSEDTVKKVKELQPDYLFTLGWSQIYKKDFINCFSQFLIGTHPSKLPYGRGRAPVPWTILDEVSHSAVSFFKIDLGIDTGKLIFQLDFEIPVRPYAMDVYRLISDRLGKGYLQLYNKIRDNKEIPLIEQPIKGATHRGKRSQTDGLIDFDKTTHYNDKLIRAVSKPFPGAYCYYKDQKIIFWEVEEDNDSNYFGTIGQILQKNDSAVLAQFSNGNLWLGKPTYTDGSAVPIKQFRVGDKMGYNIQDEIFYLRQQLKKNDTTI